MSVNLHYRVATAEDAPTLKATIEAGFAAEDTRQDWTSDMALGARFRMPLEAITTKIAKPEQAYIIATDDDGTLVSCFDVGKSQPDMAYFAMFVVTEEFQQRGVGRRVLAYAEEFCQQSWGVDRMELNALSTRQNLLAWYMRCGYEKTGELKPFPREEFADLDLPEDLCFVQLEKKLKAKTAA